MAIIQAYNVKAADIRAELKAAGWSHKFTRGSHERWQKDTDLSRTLEFTVHRGHINPAGATEVRKTLAADAAWEKEQISNPLHRKAEIPAIATKRVTEWISGDTPEVDCVFTVGPKFLPRRSLGARVLITSIDADAIWACELGPPRSIEFFVEAWDATIPKPETNPEVVVVVQAPTEGESAAADSGVSVLGPKWAAMSMAQRKQAIEDHINKLNLQIRTIDIAEHFGVTKREVRHCLQELVSENRLSANGHTSSRIYSPRSTTSSSPLTPGTEMTVTTSDTQLKTEASSQAALTAAVSADSFLKATGRLASVGDIAHKMKKHRSWVHRMVNQAKTEGFLTEENVTETPGRAVYRPTPKFYLSYPKAAATESKEDARTPADLPYAPTRDALLAAMGLPQSDLDMKDLMLRVYERTVDYNDLALSFRRVGWSEGEDVDQFLTGLKAKADGFHSTREKVVHLEEQLQAAKQQLQEQASRPAPNLPPCGPPPFSLTPDQSELLGYFVSKLDTPAVRLMLGRSPTAAEVFTRVLEAGIAALSREL